MSTSESGGGNTPELSKKENIVAGGSPANANKKLDTESPGAKVLSVLVIFCSLPVYRIAREEDRTRRVMGLTPEMEADTIA